MQHLKLKTSFPIGFYNRYSLSTVVGRHNTKQRTVYLLSPGASPARGTRAMAWMPCSASPKEGRVALRETEQGGGMRDFRFRANWLFKGSILASHCRDVFAGTALSD